MLIIFDCDGVLIDSEHIAAKHEANAANLLGHSLSEEEVLNEFVGRPSRYIWEKVVKDLGRPLPEGFLEQHKKSLEAIFAKKLLPIDGIKKSLDGISFQKCVASSTEKSKLITNLKTTGLFDYFGNNVFSASQVERAKPFPDLFLFAAKEMGFATNECLVIEDSIAGVRAAKSANMAVFGFVGGSHIKNRQNKDSYSEKLIYNGALEVFDNMENLNEIISNYLL